MNAVTTLFLLLFSFQVRADLLTENFSTLTNSASGTAVWNVALGIVHPGLQVTNYQVIAQPVVSGTNFSVGDGSDGPFNSTTYSNFGTVSGSTIIVNAGSRPSLNVTSFQLNNGDTLTAINGPLVIYSQSTVQIDGIIDCDGIDGSPASGASGGAGGSGMCGGSAGGAGGNATVSGTQGLPVTGTVTGGFGGIYVSGSVGAGGGGGAAYSGNDGSNGTASTPATNTGGAGGSGSTGANHQFTILNGSPGGGGGSGSATGGGGGGGGGGGTVIIHAVGNVTISATGLITARGGLGGSSVSGGGGGGGGGGSVKIFTPGNIDQVAGTDVDVFGGNGGTPVSGTAGPGGTGSFGRTWLNATAFPGAGGESHPSLLLQTGTIEYNTGVSQTAISLPYDVSSTTVIYNAASTDVTSADIGVEVAGSTDNFVINDTGWLPVSSLSTLNNHRYFKFRISLNNSNAAAPTTFSSFTVDYNQNLPAPAPGPSPSPAPGPSPSPLPSPLPTGGISPANETYQFSGGCGTIKSIHNDDDKSGPKAIVIFSLMLLPLIAAASMRSRKSVLKIN